MNSRNYDHTEETFLGCLLLSPSQLEEVEAVTTDMLAEPHHRAILKAARYVARAGRPVSTQALLSVLPKEMGDQGPTAAIIAALRANAADAGSAVDYSEVLLEREAKRKVSDTMDWVAEEIRRGEKSIDEVAAAASQRMARVLELAAPAKREKLATAAHRALLAPRPAGETAAAGITTGIDPLDAITGRLYGLTFLLGSQGEGKSALATQIATHNAEAGRPALIFQFEMDAEEMGVREVAARAGINLAEAMHAQIDAFQREEIEEAVRLMGHLPIYVVDKAKMTVRQIGAMARAMQRSVGLSVVVIDQLDKIKPEGKHRDRFERMEEITSDLKELAKDMPSVTFIVLGQRTRGSQRRDDPTPEINDADAPGIERNADVILAVWFPRNWILRQRPKRNAGGEEMERWEMDLRRNENKAEAIVLKHRRRKAFEQCEMRFDGERMRFAEFKAVGS